MTAFSLPQDTAQPLLAIAHASRQAAQTLASLSTEDRNRAIEAIAAALEARASDIVMAKRRSVPALRWCRRFSRG